MMKGKLNINCDNGCGWTVELNLGEDMKPYLDKKCPQCEGEKVLITQEDIETYEAMVGMVKVAEKYLTPEKKTEPVIVGIKVMDGKIKKISVDMEDV
jgi:hypothetical protein